MLRVNFYLKDPKASEKETLIYLFVTYKGERIKLSTGEKIAPKNWNLESGSVKMSKSFEQGTALNIRLNNIDNKVQKVYSTFVIQNNSEPEVYELRDLITEAVRPDMLADSGEKKAKDFIEYYSMVLEKMKNEFNTRTQKFISKETIKNRKNVLTTLKKFKSVIRWNEISSPDFCDKYTSFLRSENYALNTIGSHIKSVKTVANKAKLEGYPVNVPSTLKRMSEETEAIALTFEELVAVEQIEGLPPYLDNARDIFLLGCATGLRWGDLSRLSIVEHFDIENKTITIKTNKTAKTVVIPFLPYLERLLQKYNIEGVQTLPRFISGTKFNIYIKEVMKKLDFMNETVAKHITKQEMHILTKPKYKMVSAHTCRRTFATICYKQGIRTALIMSITGHKTEHEFFKYIRITPSENAKEFLKAFQTAFTA